MNKPITIFARDSLVSVLVAAIALGPAAPAFAGPQNINPRTPGVTWSESAGQWQIVAPNGSIIHYDSFDIAMGEAVRFIQPNADARVLNRILGSAPTRIDGALSGNGHIYIVNPAGVFFGAGSTVNVNGLHAAAGRISDEDFASGTDRFTGVTGTVSNAGTISGCEGLGDGCAVAARAVSLVGAQVVNEASGRILAQDGWIVIAAGNDVLIGRDADGRGILLRVEGAADAVFDRDATGVLNQGVLEAGATGSVSLGAGDLYGTAIFSNNAIHARKLALESNNRGDIALGGDIQSDSVDIKMLGSRPGELRGAATDGSTTTVRTDALSLSANSSGGALDVGEGLAFRSTDDAATGPAVVAISQNTTLTTSALENLDVAPGADTVMTLTSTTGDVVIDERALVAGTRLGTDATLTDVRGAEALEVASLVVQGGVRSEADLVAATGSIAVAGDLELVTRPTEALVSALGGALVVDGDIEMTDGGRLRLEAQNVTVGKTENEIASGGTIRTTGTVQGGVVIQSAQDVKVGTIDTRGLEDVAGGHVEVIAGGDVAVSGAILTGGGLNSDPTRANLDGGRVTVQAGDTLTLDDVVTGGAAAAGAGEIALSANQIVLSGALDASGGLVGNERGRRDRDVTVDGALSLDADEISILGGNVSLNGPIREATLTGGEQRTVELGIAAAGTTRLGDVEVESLAISSQGSEIVFTDDVSVDTSVEIGFDIPGTETGTVRGEGATVRANSVALAAIETIDPDGRSTEIALGDGLAFELSAIPATEDAAAVQARLILSQDKTLAGESVSRFLDATTVSDGTPLALELRSNDVVSLDATARADVADTDLLIGARRFEALTPSGTPADFELRSLDLRTREALDVNFGVAADRVSLHGATAGVGDVTVRSTIDARELELIAGDGTGGAGVESRVVVDPAARLRGTHPEASVALIQDASIDSANLPGLAVFGGSVEGMGYGLESRDGSVTLSPASQAAFGGSRLTVIGQEGVDLGSDELFLASLTATTPGDLRVGARVNTTDGATIALRSGTDGLGDLTVSSRLAADHIELSAGALNGSGSTARVLFEDGARLSASTGDARPLSFALSQDAGVGPAIGAGLRSDVPGLDLFGGDIAGMEYALRSFGSSVVIDDSLLVNGTDLELRGQTGISVSQDLDVLGLKLTGATTLSGDVMSSGDIDVVGALTLNGVGDQALTAGSDAGDVLESIGAITKTSDGALTLTGHEIEVATVSTARRGHDLTITGTGAVKTGALDASGGVLSNGGAVNVTSTTGSVEVASIDARGSNGSSDPSAPTAGYTGGNVVVSGTTVAIGNVTTRGGEATALEEGGTDRSAAGGDAGSVQILASAATGGITLRGAIDARGGNGDSSNPDVLPPLAGAANDVTLTGDVLLDAALVALRGDVVTVTGGVGPIAARVPSAASGTTALVVVGDTGVSFGGDLAATRVDIEVKTGDLDLASGGVSRISADTVRLAATDGAGGNTENEVVLDGLTFANEPRTGTFPSTLAFKLTLEQDRSIGTGGSDLPADPLFAGVTSTSRALELISYDGSIVLDGPEAVAHVNGTDLLLAANGGIQVNGAGLNVGSLAFGYSGVDDEIVGGDATVDGDVTVTKGLRMYGDLAVAGDVSVVGTASFVGESDQTLHLDSGHTLTLLGSSVSKTTGGRLHLDADRIALSPTATLQTIENLGGQLEIGSAAADGLVKGVFVDGAPVPGVGPASLTLRGTAAAGGGPAIVVNGTRSVDGVGEKALLVADGDLVLDARVAADEDGTTTGTGTWSVDGDILAYGDVDLRGAGALDAGRDSYTIEARRQGVVSRSDRGGELRIAGLASADADVRLVAQGPIPAEDGSDPFPGAIHTAGDFTVAHGLTFAGTTETAGATTVRAGGDVSFDRIQGEGDLDIASQGTVALRDDVIMDDGTSFAVAGDQGVLFASTSDLQTVQAGSITLGEGAARPARGQASLFRDGDLALDATTGNLTIGRHQRLVVAGDVEMAAARTATLSNVAALDVDVRAGTIAVFGGATVAANRIGLSSQPDVRGGGTATFATPTGTEVSSNAQTGDVVLRQLYDGGGRLTYASLVGDATPAVGAFPNVDGPARIDFALETPRFLRSAPIVRPRGDAQRLAEARFARPLWADELLVYLEERSLVAPTAQEEEALPPVAAGPSDAKAKTDGAPIGDAALKTLPPYRALFRPSTEIDPDTGLIVGQNRVDEIRAEFARAASRGGDLASAIESDPAARANRDQLAELFAASARALDARQNARFREIVLARVAPAGVSPQQLDAVVP